MRGVWHSSHRECSSIERSWILLSWIRLKRWVCLSWVRLRWVRGIRLNPRIRLIHLNSWVRLIRLNSWVRLVHLNRWKRLVRVLAAPGYPLPWTPRACIARSQPVIQTSSVEDVPTARHLHQYSHLEPVYALRSHAGRTLLVTVRSVFICKLENWNANFHQDYVFLHFLPPLASSDQQECHNNQSDWVRTL